MATGNGKPLISQGERILNERDTAASLHLYRKSLPYLSMVLASLTPGMVVLVCRAHQDPKNNGEGSKMLLNWFEFCALVDRRC